MTTLDQVKISTTPFELGNGEVIYVPGPFSLMTADEKNREQVDEQSYDGDAKSDASTEFGHIRLSPLTPRREGGLVGGHCILPPTLFLHCLERKWGTTHPFAGRFHPIRGSVVPACTLVFPAPRDQAEAEVIWTILRAAYSHALGSKEQHVN